MSDAAGVSIDWADLDGALLLVSPTESVPGSDTQLGTTFAVRADVAVLDGPRAGEGLVDILILPTVLQSQVRPSIDSGMVLGRLGRGQATDGGEPPFVMSRATESDKMLAREHLAKTAVLPLR